MKKYIFSLLAFCQILLSSDSINIDFKYIDLENFIKIVSKTINKDILVTTKINYKINYISKGTIEKNKLLGILKVILKSNNLLLEEKNDLLIVKKINNNNLNTKIIFLKNSDAKEIYNTLMKLKSKDNTKITYDIESNSIILVGTSSQLRIIGSLINDLDIDKQQVYVQARIIEISETKTSNVGIKYGLNGYSATNSGLISFSSALNNNGALMTVNSHALNGYGYDSRTLKNNLSLGATINLLKINNALDVVSQPSILCINNQKSSIYVGETRTIKIGTTISSGGNISDKYTREDIGLKLSIKPRISNQNKVTLEIETIVEDITNGIVSQPNTIKKVVKTTAIVNNAESVIIGGLIKNKKEIIHDKVAFFGDIPILGTLFRNKYEINDKINLVIIITPYIVPKSKDLTYVRNKLIQLKQLEDNYTKRLLLKLKENKITLKLETKAKIKTKEQKTNEELHKQRLKSIFGI